MMTERKIYPSDARFLRSHLRSPLPVATNASIHKPAMKTSRLFFATALFTLTGSVLAGVPTAGKSPVTPEDETSLWLFSAESTYTTRSKFRDSRFGRGDSLDSDYSVDRRFPVSGKSYFRLGGEYERFDFGGTNNGQPNHLQAMYAHLAYEYVVHDHAAAGVEIDPGFYFQNRISGDAFDIPWRIFVTFPLKKDRVYGVIGVGGSLYQDPVVVGGGGIIWLINDKLRLEAVAPKPALVYNPSDKWEFRLLGEAVYESFRTDSVRNAASSIHLQNAVVQYSEYRSGVQVSYSGFKPFEILAGAGYTFERSFDFFRAEQRESAGGAPYFKLGISAKF